MKKSKFLEILSYIMFFVMCAVSLSSWDKIPNNIPIHFDFYGKATTLGPKIFSLIPIFFYFLIITLLSFVAKYNSRKLSGSELAKEAELLLVIQFIIGLIFLYINWVITREQISNLNPWIFYALVTSIVCAVAKFKFLK